MESRKKRNIERWTLCRADARSSRSAGRIAPIDVATLGAFTPDKETSERGLVFGPDGLDEVFAFPLHAEAARRFFTARSISCAHAYELA